MRPGARRAVGLGVLLVGCGAGEASTSGTPGAAQSLWLAPRESVAQSSALEARLPAVASGWVELRSARGALDASFRLRSARPRPGRDVGGYRVYPAALADTPEQASNAHGSLSLRRTHGGIEDLVLLREKPAREELSYDLSLGRGVAGLRLVDRTLELLDDGGAPRIRMEPPVITGDDGRQVDVAVSIEGCAVDESPAAPWGRPVVAPGAAACTLRLSWSGVRYPAVLDPLWTGTSAMVSSRINHMAIKLQDGRVLVAGGSPIGGNADRLAQLYDRASDSWAKTGNMNRERIDAAVVLLDDGSPLLCGGGPQTSMVTCERYQVGPGQFTPVAPMTAERSGHTLNRLADGRVVAIGGASVKVVEAYDPLSNSWQDVGQLKVARTNHCTFALPDGRLLAASGQDGSLGVASTEIVDLTAGTVGDGPKLAKARPSAGCVALDDGRLMMVGGANGDASVGATTEIFDPQVGAWVFGPSMNVGRRELRAVQLLSGKVFVTGGWEMPSGNRTTSTEVLDLALGTWSEVEPMAVARGGHTASLLDTGEVLVAGGYNSSFLTPAAELFALIAGSGKCGVDGECTSGHCVDGVCCDTACAAPCTACTAKKKGFGVDGACEPVAAGLDPDGDCDDDGSPACTLDGTCDGKGACRSYAQGAGCAPSPCSSGDECASGHCVDGVCCDTACAAPCTACTAARKGLGVDGVCEPIAAGLDPDDECEPDPDYPASCRADGSCDGAGQCRKYALPGTLCADAECAAGAESAPRCDGKGVCAFKLKTCSPYVCDKQGKLCADSCSDDTRCDAGSHCDVASSACVADLAAGSGCSSPSQCQSGYCVDGVCCDAACEGPCEACSASQKGEGDDGACGPVVAGTDPDGDCPDDGLASCDRNGLCDGKGQCQSYALGTECSPFRECVGSGVASRVCDGQGECKVSPDVATCGSYGCRFGECLTSCEDDGDCALGFVCGKGACSKPLGPGASCSKATQCESGFCVDGVCCDSPCTGQCEACGETGSVGTCSVVEGNPRGERAPCNHDDVECAGTCDGKNRQLCTYPGETRACKASVCSGAVLVPVVCGGNGACAIVPSINCAPYGCDAAACKVSCSSAADCAAGASCDVDKKQCVFEDASCSDAFTLRLANGTETSCAPYRCIGGACQQQCSLAADCAQDHACKSGKCVYDPTSGAAGAPSAAAGSPGASGSSGSSQAPASQAGQAGAPQTPAAPAAAPASDEGSSGCGCRTSPASSHGALATLALATLMIERRRRSNRRRPG